MRQKTHRPFVFGTRKAKAGLGHAVELGTQQVDALHGVHVFLGDDVAISTLRVTAATKQISPSPRKNK